MSKLIFDVNLCTGCRACELACSFVSEGVFAPTKSRIRIFRLDKEGVDIPIGCAHCDDAPCITICPVKAITRDKLTQAVLIDKDICIGCKVCLISCPFGAIQYDQTKHLFYKCDLCKGEPECVKWCFTGAVQYTKQVSQLVHKKQRQYALKLLKASQGIRKSIPK